MELTKKQKNIIEAKENKIVVLASAGAGKTTVLSDRLKYLMTAGFEQKKIVAITFTNAAAEELKERVGDSGQGCFIGTVHSYANHLLTSISIDTSKFIKNEDFDGLFKLVKANPKCIQEVDHLLLDEAQDSTREQFDFFLDLIKPKNFFFVGDHRQAIYSFAEGDSEFFYNLSEEPDVKCYHLNDNFRNASEILDFARDLLDPLGYKYEDDSIARNTTYGQVYRIEYSIDRIGDLILDDFDSDFRDWFVLARTNKEVDEIREGLARMDIPCETFKKAELSNKGLKEKMENNTVKVLTIHTSKGLENKNVVACGMRYYNPEERRVNYVAATRARKLLVWCSTPKKRKLKKKMLDWS